MDQELSDDDLIVDTVGDWSEEKYALVTCYASVFATSMKNKWAERIYVDLFAGSGRAAIGRRLLESTPLRVLGISDTFNRYIFSELEPGKVHALKARAGALYPKTDVIYFEGDSNTNVEQIIDDIPSGSAGHRVLTFCYVDPYKLRNLRFATIRRLASERFVDFLVLLPTMDPGRNPQTYLPARDHTISDFTGNDGWREEWHPGHSSTFGDFVADAFGRSMKNLGYHYDGLAATHEMRNSKNSPIYRLALFSRSELGPKFWKACRKYAPKQKSLF